MTNKRFAQVLVIIVVANLASLATAYVSTKMIQSMVAKRIAQAAQAKTSEEGLMEN